VARVPFARWRIRFGQPGPTGGPHSARLAEPDALRARRTGRAVVRAAGRLPGEYKCLPRAMAACWMLQRRKIGHALIFGVSEASRRGTLDDLHAWVSSSEQVIVGEGEQVHHPVLVLHWPEVLREYS